MHVELARSVLADSFVERNSLTSLDGGCIPEPSSAPHFERLAKAFS
jgi:hypothetical protein